MRLIKRIESKMSKIVYIDITKLYSSRELSGIENVTVEAIESLSRSSNIVLVRFYKGGFLQCEDWRSGDEHLTHNKPPQFSWRLYFKERFKYLVPNRFLYLLGYLKFNLTFTLKCKREIDFLHLSSGDLLIIPEVVLNRSHQAYLLQLQNSGVRTVPIVHDLIAVNDEAYSPSQISFAFSKYLKITEKSHKVITPSLYTKTELIKYIHKSDLEPSQEQEIIVIQPRARKAVQPTQDCIDESFSGVKLLYVSSIVKRKNHLETIELLTNICSRKSMEIELTLVAASGDMVNILARSISKLKDPHLKIKLLRNIPECCLTKVYNSSDVAIYLSKEEGYGMPIRDALSVNLPVICSDIAVFREFQYLSTQIYFTDGTPDQTIGLIKKALHSREIQSKSNIKAPNNAWVEIID